VNRRHQKTIEAVFKEPTASNIRWKDIESLFSALGAEISEGSGSRVRVKLNNNRAVFHRPHPNPSTGKGAVESVRRFLVNSGVQS